MPSRRSRHFVAILVGGLLLLTVSGLGVAEVALRGLAQDRLAAATDRIAGEDGPLSGARVTLSDGLMLAQLATGGLRVDAAVPESAVGALLSDQFDGRVREVWFESGLVIAAVEVPVGSKAVDAEVGFAVTALDGGIRATPTLLRVGGLQLPADMLTRLIGPGATSGIVLGTALPDDLRVVDVTVTDDELVAELFLSRG